MGKFLGFSIGPLVAALISFITVPVTTYFIIPEEFGKASMFTVIQSFLVTFVYLGMDQAYTREYNGQEDKKKLFQNASIVPLVLTFILTFLIMIFHKEFSYLLFEDDRYFTVSILFGCIIISTVLERFILLSIRMGERALEYSSYSVLIKLSVFAFTVVLLLLGRRDFLVVVYSAIFGQFIGDTILFIKYRKLLFFTKSNFDLQLIKKMFYFGFPIIIAASLNNLLNTMGRFFLRGYSTFHELGIYTAALKIAAILSIIQATFTSFWVPVAYRWHQEDKEMKYFNFISRLTLLLMTIVFFFVVFFKKYIVLILSADYKQAEYVASLLSLTPILYTLSETTTLGIVFSGKSVYNLIVSFISIIPAIVLNIILVPSYGTVGASIATATSYMFFCFLRTYFSRRCGFFIEFKMQSIVIVIIYITSIVNAFNFKEITVFNIMMFLLVVLLQLKTFKITIQAIKNPNDWNFD